MRYSTNVIFLKKIWSKVKFNINSFLNVITRLIKKEKLINEEEIELPKKILDYEINEKEINEFDDNDIVDTKILKNLYNNIGIIVSLNTFNNLENDEASYIYINKSKTLQLEPVFFPLEYANLKNYTTLAKIWNRDKFIIRSLVNIPYILYSPALISKKENIKKWRSIQNNKRYIRINEHHKIKRINVLEIINGFPELKKYAWDYEEFSLIKAKEKINEGIPFFLLQQDTNIDQNWIEVIPHKGFQETLIWVVRNGNKTIYTRLKAMKVLEKIIKYRKYNFAKKVTLDDHTYHSTIYFYAGLAQKNKKNEWEITVEYVIGENNKKSTWEVGIETQFEKRKKVEQKEYLKKLREVFQLFLEYLNIYYPGIHEFGLQFVISDEGNPLFHSIKTKWYVLNKIQNWDRDMWELVVTKPLELAIFFKKEMGIFNNEENLLG